MQYEAVIGLEVHCQLLTRSKLFCGCSTRFGDPPDTNICPVCLGMPGVLPVLNRHAVDLALRAALSLDCEIRPQSIFARKNYFYPDLPKGYQISQYEQPLAERGHMQIDSGDASRRIGITRIHMEEDAGKLLHEGFPDSDRKSYVDYNRACTPLIEIVSDPDLRSPAEAHAYYHDLRDLLVYIGVTDGNMEEGSLRCDANISLRPVGEEKLGTKAELKNLNSFKFVQQSLEYEIARQTRVLEAGDAVIQETRLFDPKEGRTHPMRSKEDAHDYRYFPEPDLPPLEVDAAWIAKVKQALPELPATRRTRLAREYRLPEQDASVLTGDRALADYFESVARAGGDPEGDGKAAANWILGEALRKLNEEKAGMIALPDRLPPGSLSGLIGLVRKGTISGKAAKDVFEAIYGTGADPADIVRERGLEQISDEGPIVAAIETVIAASPNQLAQYRAGKTTLLGYFVGQVLKATKGRANPQLVNRLLKDRLDGS